MGLGFGVFGDVSGAEAMAHLACSLACEELS